MKRRAVAIIVLAILALAGCGAAAVSPGSGRATFVVHCYDVGASALHGHSGIIDVEKGWSGFREVNRVVYDPAKVSVKQMEEWLKGAGTYVRTLEPQPESREEETSR